MWQLVFCFWPFVYLPTLKEWIYTWWTLWPRIASGVNCVRETQFASWLWPPGRYPLAVYVRPDSQKLSAFAYSVRPTVPRRFEVFWYGANIWRVWMSNVILKGFGDGHSQSPAKEMAQEKLSEAKMRSHLLTCFEKKQLTSFPIKWEEESKRGVFVLSNAGNRTLLYLSHARDLWWRWYHKPKWTGFVCLVCN